MLAEVALDVAKIDESDPPLPKYAVAEASHRASVDSAAASEIVHVGIALGLYVGCNRCVACIRGRNQPSGGEALG